MKYSKFLMGGQLDRCGKWVEMGHGQFAMWWTAFFAHEAVQCRWPSIIAFPGITTLRWPVHMWLRNGNPFHCRVFRALLSRKAIGLRRPIKARSPRITHGICFHMVSMEIMKSPHWGYLWPSPARDLPREEIQLLDPCLILTNPTALYPDIYLIHIPS